MTARIGCCGTFLATVGALQIVFFAFSQPLWPIIQFESFQDVPSEQIATWTLMMFLLHWQLAINV